MYFLTNFGSFVYYSNFKISSLTPTINTKATDFYILTWYLPKSVNYTIYNNSKFVWSWIYQVYIFKCAKRSNLSTLSKYYAYYMGYNFYFVCFVPLHTWSHRSVKQTCHHWGAAPAGDRVFLIVPDGSSHSKLGSNTATILLVCAILLCMGTVHTARLEDKVQDWVHSLYLGFKGENSAHQICKVSILPSEPSPYPSSQFSCFMAMKLYSISCNIYYFNYMFYPQIY
jgi:hypothetical protein